MTDEMQECYLKFKHNIFTLSTLLDLRVLQKCCNRYLYSVTAVHVALRSVSRELTFSTIFLSIFRICARSDALMDISKLRASLLRVVGEIDGWPSRSFGPGVA
jgi:hypothetical protein